MYIVAIGDFDETVAILQYTRVLCQQNIANKKIRIWFLQWKNSFESFINKNILRHFFNSEGKFVNL